MTKWVTEIIQNKIAFQTTHEQDRQTRFFAAVVGVDPQNNVEGPYPPSTPSFPFPLKVDP